jgi:hypothetical protein
MIKIITSFDQRYYDLIGRDCVSSWLKYWPRTWRLTCYLENLEIPKDTRIETLDFDTLDPDYRAFQKEPGIKSRAKTFAKKAYCVMHAMGSRDADWITWIDADVISVQPGIGEVLKDTLDPALLTMHMGVWYHSNKTGQSGRWFVPETGFFAINLRHPGSRDFVQHYRSRYINRNFSGLRRGYDNDVFGSAVLSTQDHVHLDLCQGLDKSYRTPLKHTKFGRYLRHYKAQHSKEYYRLQVTDQ